MSKNLPATLTDVQLGNARLLAREGNREVVIRKTLGLAAGQWKSLREADDSQLTEALDYGRAEGAAEVIVFMKRMMTERNSMRAAEWLGERVFDLRPPSKIVTDDATPRVQIIINDAMSPDDYRRTIDVKADTLPTTR